jgi:hypothetical protein
VSYYTALLVERHPDSVQAIFEGDHPTVRGGVPTTTKIANDHTLFTVTFDSHTLFLAHLDRADFDRKLTGYQNLRHLPTVPKFIVPYLRCICIVCGKHQRQFSYRLYFVKLPCSRPWSVGTRLSGVILRR